MPSDYRCSDLNKGHICPFDDRLSTREANTETFLMSNMHPQTHHLNAGAWKSLETYVRDQFVTGNMEAYIYAGCYGDAGKLKIKLQFPSCVEKSLS